MAVADEDGAIPRSACANQSASTSACGDDGATAAAVLDPGDDPINTVATVLESVLGTNKAAGVIATAYAATEVRT